MELNVSSGRPKATLIQRFDGSAVLLGPEARKIEFENGTTRNEAMAQAENVGWVIVIEHLTARKNTGSDNRSKTEREP